MSLRVSAVQMVSGAAVSVNLNDALEHLEKASRQGVQLAVLPENFACFDSGSALAELACQEQQYAAIRGRLAEQAKRLGMWIVAGTLPLPAADGRCYASSLVFNDSGECVADYRKLHLFDADVGDAQQRYRESERYAPGERPCVIDTPWGRLGVAVCYDLRFPELFRLMLDDGMELLALPAAFTRRTGLAHWLPLLRARAIENQVAVIAANQGGVHSARRETSGGSCVIDSWGGVLAELGFGAGIATADIDIAAQRALRQEMPVSQHRRF